MKELSGAKKFVFHLKPCDYQEIIDWAKNEVKEYKKLIKIIKKLKLGVENGSKQS